MRKSLGLFAGAVVVASALMTGVASAATPPAPNPPTMTTHVDAIVEDTTAGLRFVPNTVPVGTIEVRLLDERANKPTDVALYSFSGVVPISIVGAGNSVTVTVSQPYSPQIQAQAYPAPTPPCCVGLATLHVVPASTTITQNTHVDVFVDDVYPCSPPGCNAFGMHIEPRIIPVGDVDITLHDQRVNKTGTLDLDSGLSAFTVDGMTGDGAHRVFRVQQLLSGQTINARIVGANPPCCYATAYINVVAPTFPTPNDPANTINLVIKSTGISAPNRIIGNIEPIINGPRTLPDRPWTSLDVTSGVKTSVIVTNASGVAQKCSIGGVSGFNNVSVGKTAKVTKKVLLGFNSANKYVLSCVAGAETKAFAIWLV